MEHLDLCKISKVNCVRLTEKINDSVFLIDFSNFYIKKNVNKSL